MGYSDLIRLGDSFDGDSTLDTNFVFSNAILANGKNVEVQISATGGSGDSDDVEVYQFNSLSGTNGTFDNVGKSLGTLTLDSDSEVTKTFYVKVSRAFKIGLRMEAASSETPIYIGTYTINEDADNRNYD